MNCRRGKYPCFENAGIFYFDPANKKTRSVCERVKGIVPKCVMVSLDDFPLFIPGRDLEEGGRRFLKFQLGGFVDLNEFVVLFEFGFQNNIHVPNE